MTTTIVKWNTSPLAFPNCARGSSPSTTEASIQSIFSASDKKENSQLGIVVDVESIRAITQARIRPHTADFGFGLLSGAVPVLEVIAIVPAPCPRRAADAVAASVFSSAALAFEVVVVEVPAAAAANLPMALQAFVDGPDGEDQSRGSSRTHSNSMGVWKRHGVARKLLTSHAFDSLLTAANSGAPIIRFSFGTAASSCARQKPGS